MRSCSYYEKFLATGEVKCIDDEIPFEIPQRWEWCRISSIFQLNPRIEANDDMLAAFIPMEAISAVYGSEYRYYERKWKEIKSGFTQFADGDIAFAKITPCFQNRKSAVFSNLPNGIGAGTTELKVLRPYGETINRFYTLYFLESPYFIDEATFKGTANQQRIVVGYLENKLFPLPPIEEQRRIAGKIAEVLPIADRYGKTQTKLDNLNVELKNILKKSVLQEAIQGKLVPQIEAEGTAQELLEQIQQEKQKLAKEGKLKKSALNDSIIGSKVVDITGDIPFEIPPTWMWCRFGTIVKMRIGKTPPRGEQVYWSNGKHNWVSISDMVEGGTIKAVKEKVSNIAVNEIFKCYPTPKGSLLMSFKLTVGRTSILGVDAYHNEAIITIVPYADVNNIFRDYLFYILPTISNSGDSKDAIKGKTLNNKSLNNLLIPLPPLLEQKRIVTKIELVNSKIKG